MKNTTKFIITLCAVLTVMLGVGYLTLALTGCEAPTVQDNYSARFTAEAKKVADKTREIEGLESELTELNKDKVANADKIAATELKLENAKSELANLLQSINEWHETLKRSAFALYKSARKSWNEARDEYEYDQTRHLYAAAYKEYNLLLKLPAILKSDDEMAWVYYYIGKILLERSFDQTGQGRNSDIEKAKKYLRDVIYWVPDYAHPIEGIEKQHGIKVPSKTK